MFWTIEHIDQLYKPFEKDQLLKILFNENQWMCPGTDFESIWGECCVQKDIYFKVLVLLDRPSFYCSCQKKDQLCKHALALIKLYLHKQSIFVYGSPKFNYKLVQPSENVIAADQRQIKKEDDNKKDAAKEKRWQARLELMKDGVQELKDWILHLFELGLNQFEVNEEKTWHYISSRMMDYKLSGLSMMIKDIYQQISIHTDWTEYLSLKLGEMYSLCEAFLQQKSETNALTERYYQLLGKQINKKELMSGPSIMDKKWVVLKIIYSKNSEDIPYRKVWIRSLESSKYLFFLDYNFRGAGYDTKFSVNQQFESFIYVYPGVDQKRACHGEINNLTPSKFEYREDFSGLEDLKDQYLEQYSRFPFDCELTGMMQLSFNVDDQENLSCIDAFGYKVPVIAEKKEIWLLLSCSAGHPIMAFVHWDGIKLKVFSIQYNESYHTV